MLSFACQKCQKKLSIQDEHAGKKVKCPSCGDVSVAPKPTLPIADALAETPTADLPVGKVVSHDTALTEILAPPQGAGELGRLGKYRVLAVLGRGGMGVVYKAEDPLLKRTVALKAVLPSLGASGQIHKRFLREARAMAQLEHEHVVRLYEVNQDRNIPFIAMEFLTGESLEHRLRRGLVPIAEILRISREIATGLAAAHQQNLIHRDIKPANIFLVGPTGRVKILDFGLARAEAEDSRLTASGAVLGTPSYMSPEQTRGEPVDFRCDLFSLGVVLYRLSTNKEPFAGTDALSTMMAIATNTPLAPQMQNFDVPAELSDLVMQLLDKNPARRGTAQDVVDALTRIEKGEPPPARPKTVPAKEVVGEAPKKVSTRAPKPKTPPKKVPWLIVIAIALAALFLCVGVPLIAAVIYFFV